MHNRSVQIEFDPAKARANLAKHKASFAHAEQALRDVHAVTIEDPDALGEKRFVTLGMGLAGLANAQQASTSKDKDADSEEKQELSEVTVTGSRIQITGFSSPNPITVLDRETIDALPDGADRLLAAIT